MFRLEKQHVHDSLLYINIEEVSSHVKLKNIEFAGFLLVFLT